MEPAIKKRLRLIDAISAASLVAIVIATAAAGFWPMHASRMAALEATDLLDQDLDKLKGLPQTLAQLEAALESERALLREAQARFPSTDAMDSFMADVARVADKSGMTIDSVKPKDPQEAPNYRVLPLAINGVGTFESCYGFLTGLRKIDRLTRLDEVILQIESTGGSDRDNADTQPLCRVSLVLSTFKAK